MYSIIHTPTPDLDKSKEFYQDLGFTSVEHEHDVLFTDGLIWIVINPDRFARPGLKLIKDSWATEASILSGFENLHQIEGGYLLSDKSGVFIYLEEGSADFFEKSVGNSVSHLGNYSGISIETTDIERSMKVWQVLGFSKHSGAKDKGYVILADPKGFKISLMNPLLCPHLFLNPSMTFFNGGNNLEIINGIRSLGIPITEEITHFNQAGIADNVVLTDPGGFGIFVFND